MSPDSRSWTGGDAEPATTVTVYPDGPLILRGDFEVRQVNGDLVPTSRVVALCRCGLSAVKPLCDGSHQVGQPRAAP